MAKHLKKPGPKPTKYSKRSYDQLRRAFFILRLIGEGRAKTAREVHRLMIEDVGISIHQRTIRRDIYALWEGCFINRDPGADGQIWIDEPLSVTVEIKDL